MDIVDAQIHIGPGRIDETLAAMDALGVRAVMIDEYWMANPAAGDPGYAVAHSAFRPVQPTAELAAMTHPQRFSYLVRLDRKDREVAAVIRLAGDAPHARALRITPGMQAVEARAFAAGDYETIFALAADAGLPLFIFAPGQAQVVGRHAEKHPSLRIVVDHCGLFSNSMRRVLAGDPPISREAQLAAFDEVLALAALPNIALKWAHAPAMFEQPGYPGEGLWPILRKALDRFGAERMMWASDVSANQTGETWAELLFGVIGCPDLTTAEREALLGGTARAWLDWPA